MRRRNMVCNRKYTNMSRAPSLITQRKVANKRTGKSMMKCVGGVIDGHKLYLSTAGTMPFTLNGETGYYDIDMQWVSL